MRATSIDLVRRKHAGLLRSVVGSAHASDLGMADFERTGSTHESFSELLHAIDPRALIGIANAAAGLRVRRRGRIRYRNPRMQISGRSKRAANVAADLVYTIAARGRVDEFWIFEIQLSWCLAKLWRWALYETALENEYRATGRLAVFTPDPALRERIRTNLLPRIKTTPILVGPEHVERITDVGRARRNRELTILGCLFHAQSPAPFERRVEVFRAAWIAVQEVDELQGERYAALIMSLVAPEVVDEAIAELRAAGELDLPRFELFSDSERMGHSFWRGREEGRAEGREEGRQEGREAGRRDAIRTAIIDVFDLRGVVLTAEQQARIQACDSSATLERWYSAAKCGRADLVV
jgi:hypothetical protein